jgi:hypothetical protein
MVIAHASPREIGDAMQRKQQPVLIHELCDASNYFDAWLCLICFLVGRGVTKIAGHLGNPRAVLVAHRRSSNEIIAVACNALGAGL